MSRFHGCGKRILAIDCHHTNLGCWHMRSLQPLEKTLAMAPKHIKSASKRSFQDHNIKVALASIYLVV